MYWDDDPQPAVECPLGDFFTLDGASTRPVNSLAVCVNPGSAFNCYWEMPFTLRAVDADERRTKPRTLYYQIDYTLCDVPATPAFCAQFRRVNLLPKGEVVTIVDGIVGQASTSNACVQESMGTVLVGRRELKFFIDDDLSFPPSVASVPRTTSVGRTT
jgi:hypothetical protein